MENSKMSDGQFNSILENLAKLVEATATNPHDAAQIIRAAKTK